MVKLQGAARAAMAVIEEFFPGARDIRLEEVRPDGNFLNVVVSLKAGVPNVLSDVMRPEARLYKTVAVEADTGVPHSMRSCGVRTYDELLIERYRAKGMLVEANLALLYLVGCQDQRLTRV